jgi:hypothetical protein
MKKLTVWALLATLVVAGSAFAVPARSGVAANATFATGSPATTNNDDSCDIGVAPAATLLLPYFEVDLDSRAGEQTTFAITNVSAVEQVAHITLWTDYSFPVIDFNVYLTGYDVQTINLYDVIALGQIAPELGTGFDTDGSPEGEFSGDNILVDEDSCDNLPMQLSQVYIDRMQDAFTLGSTPAIPGTDIDACDDIGGQHDNAVGYATIDVASVCGTTLPSDPGYFIGPDSEALFDNVFVGDYSQVNAGQAYAQGNPMVHIRALGAEGLTADEAALADETNLPRTFYGRYQDPATPRADRRQPLPSTFAARWINGGTGEFQTFFKIWREGDVDGFADCDDVAGNVTEVTELVVFDEEENAVGAAEPGGPVSPPINLEFTLPETGLYNVGSSTFPQDEDDDVSGWMYLNLDNAAGDDIASQNWVVVSMRAEGEYSVDFDAAWLGNGCTPETDVSEVESATGIVIGPAANETPVADDQD